jgi:hypothetical protein
MAQEKPQSILTGERAMTLGKHGKPGRPCATEVRIGIPTYSGSLLIPTVRTNRCVAPACDLILWGAQGVFANG